MAISDYPVLSSVSNDDLMPLANSGTTYAATMETIKEAMQSGLLPSNFGSDNAGKFLFIGANGYVRPM